MKESGIRKAAVLLAAVAIWAGSSMSTNASLTFSTAGVGADGKEVSATATFEVLENGRLKITLVNTTTSATFGTGDTLYSLYFGGVFGLSMVS
jgi:hypothetical protein